MDPDSINIPAIRERLHYWLFYHVTLYRRVFNWYYWRVYIGEARAVCAEKGHDWSDEQLTIVDGKPCRFRQCMRCDELGDLP